jgi:hypothetical protein
MRLAAAVLLAVPVVALVAAGRPAPGVRVEVTLDPKLAAAAPAGRLLVAVGTADRPPSFTNVDPPARPVVGTDVERFAGPVVLDGSSLCFPADGLSALPAGEYRVRAVLLANRDLLVPDAPGNPYCEPVAVRLDPAAGTVVRLTLDRTYSDDAPADTKTHRYLALPSKRLSEFHGRPMRYRLGVVLPPGFDREPDRRYPLLVHVGGFGQRYTSAAGIEPDPRFVQVLLDGAGPYGDPYQVNSANNGPYGDALVREVIPHVEAAYRCGGDGRRFTAGSSTGGWVALALQVFYPDTFNGCWAQCPDPVDFAAFELIDLYDEADANAYVNRFGAERPAKRTPDGDTAYTVRHEVRLERVLGRGGRWELGGQQWASWNAVYGPRGAGGRPVPVWDGATGAIDRSVMKHWEKYDLRRVIAANWPTLGPKLAGGKVNVWVGDADDYFLNNAVWRLKRTLDKLTNPRFDGRVLIEPRKGHTSGGWTRKEMLDAMAERAGR